jgi:hypothetical protein
VAGNSVRVVGPDMKAVAAKLDKLAPAVRKHLVQELRTAAGPAAAGVQRAVRALPSKSDGTGAGLRQSIAAATHVRVNLAGAKVTILVAGAELGHTQRMLPKYLDGTKTPWRHPVHGNRNNWVTQKAKPFFGVTLRQFKASFNKSAGRALKSAARESGFNL